jgi:D-mannose binding lectin
MPSTIIGKTAHVGGVTVRLFAGGGVAGRVVMAGAKTGLAIGCAVGAVIAASLFAVDSASFAATQPNTLYAGQQIVAGQVGSYLESRSGEFALFVGPGRVTMQQHVVLAGPRGLRYANTDIWTRDDPTGRATSSNDHSTLRMQRNGNLVLATSRGRVLWSSNTAGTGRQNRVVLKNSGNLVLSTAGGRRLWASRTTRLILRPGLGLAPGARLVDRRDSQIDPVPGILTMQRDGNLVYRCARGPKVAWSTHTHTRNSRLAMETDGNLAVRGPQGRLIWSSGTQTAGPYTYMLMPPQVWTVGRLHEHRIWAAQFSCT